MSSEPSIVTAEAYCLTVAATATLDHAVHHLHAAPAESLAEAWQHPACLFATPPGQALTENDLDTGGGRQPPSRHVLDRTGLHAFARELTALGFHAGAETVWDDTTGLSFLDDSRRLSLLTLSVPCTLTAATVIDEDDGASRAVILDRYPIPAGRYLFCEIITAAGTRAHLHGIWACPGEITVEALADIEGFDAWQISADCSSCNRSWIACAGSWWFNPDPDDVGNDLEWHYEDATGHRDNTIDCPIGWCPGRVVFTV
ncbi:hypothetical protein L0U85_03335 [Glycomyces sp. L485]|uniref:hypothetical protein n=1 Tax=Glycomyces sp. L485 TaxID=2909235 RepID=UPI001F4B6556|nr:hypothetical protein [Glycomyces sp. L485]MCH7229895.1 hypothetical protein [Glycomyces sp. L485]